MFRSYLKVTWRNFLKNKFFSLVNIAGLAVGLTCCILISLYIYHEVTYDRYHKNIDRLYQVITLFGGHDKGGEQRKFASAPSPLGPMLQAEMPEIELCARLLPLFNDDKTLMQYNEGTQVNSFYENKGFLADSTFFRLFDYDFVEGNAATALMNPNSIVLDEEIAQKIFGKTAALDKIIHLNSTTNGEQDYRVTGVFKPKPAPSHIDARFFLSLSSGRFGNYVRNTTNMANNNMFFTYLLLKNGASASSLQSKLPGFVQKFMQRDLDQVGFSKSEILLPVKDIHLRSGFDSNVTPNGSPSYLYILASIAIFILLIACINFMNLATARSARRAAEVGIRKVMGAEKTAIVRQFLGESLLIAFVSFVLALLFVQLLLPYFSKASGVHLFFAPFRQINLLAAFLLLTVITGLVAGSYPAFYLAAFKPIRVLKGRFANSLSAITFRKVLVVFQFVISAVLIVAAFVISKQMNYMQSKDIGFTRDQQIVIPLRSSTAKSIYASLKNEIRKNETISDAGGSLYYPGISNLSDVNMYVKEKTLADAINIEMNWVDADFMQTLGIRPVAGRIFSKQFPADTSFRLVLNETAVRNLGFASPAAAVGHSLVFPWQGNTFEYEIVGVVQDFNFEGLKQPIQPFGFQLAGGDFNYLIVHTKAGHPAATLRAIQDSWKNLNPNEPFEYSFLDQDFQKNYEAEMRLGALIRYFMIIAITICCLGLFGLAAFSAEQRTREIGIRKVLGANVTGIVSMLSKEFIRLVLVGNLVAIPVAWYFMNKWLEEFAYRTPLSWWVFMIAILLCLVIAVITVSFQAIRAAIANPVKSLRTE